MRLDEYWGIGPKTRARLTETLGEEAAVTAIEAGDVSTLVGAGVARGRVTRILRHAHGGAALDLLATPDAREVYKQLLKQMSSYALTERAADRIRILTPLSTQDAMERRLDSVLAARDDWAALDETSRETVLAIFERYDSASGTRRAAVDTAHSLRDAGFDDGVFEPLADLSPDALDVARSALAGLEGNRETRTIGEGADERLDALRAQLAALEDTAATPDDVLASVQSDARSADGFREAFVSDVADRTGTELARIREAMPDEAADAPAFVEQTLRSLTADLRAAVDKREREVSNRLETVLSETEAEIQAATTAVGDIAFELSLARFALAFELRRPSLVTDRVIGVVDARNIFLTASGDSVQPITYAVGEHSLTVASGRPPPSDRVTVLTGANSGGKTTLLETLCQIQLLAQMGLPVPAETAEIGLVDSVVFHRRHASFNAGVLESTLRTVVPPVSAGGRVLMLVDEFEAITEPGRAADLLHGLVTLTVENDALGVFVTHLADDLEPLPEAARVDGIFAEGLTPDLELEVDYQPRFETVGRSTPEFIVSRLVANASDRSERAGYERLAEAVGESAVQRTLADARWRG